MDRRPAFGLPEALREFLLFLLLSLSLTSFSKGYHGQPFLAKEIYFVINYNNGLIRRGLLGQILSYFINQSDVTPVISATLYLHLAACMVLIYGMWAWLRLILRHGSEGVLLATFAIFATSQFLPAQAYQIGFLDVYDYVLVLAATFAILCHQYFLASVIGFIGPFIHDGFIFVWLSLAVLVLWEGQTARRFVALASPVIATAIVYFLPTEQTAAAQMAATSLPQVVKNYAIENDFGQTLSSSLHGMFQKYRHNFPHFMLAAAFFEFPTAIIVLAIGIARNNLREALTLIVAAFIPATILIVASDLSRFLVATTFSALLAVLYMHSIRPTPPARWPLILVCSIVATFGFLTPSVTADFEVASVTDRGFISLANTPIGKAMASSVAFYSRNFKASISREKLFNP